MNFIIPIKVLVDREMPEQEGVSYRTMLSSYSSRCKTIIGTKGEFNVKVRLDEEVVVAIFRDTYEGETKLLKMTKWFVGKKKLEMYSDTSDEPASAIVRLVPHESKNIIKISFR